MNEQDIVSICATIMLTSGYVANMDQAIVLAKRLYEGCANAE